MGYGKTEHTGGSGDKGIDGIIHQDKLGIEKIYYQTKRYAENNAVGAHDVRDFVGSLDYKGTNKGIFITTSTFPKNTEEELKQTSKNIILIDGIKLAEHMIENNVGVSEKESYKIKRIDNDYFDEDND